MTDYYLVDGSEVRYIGPNAYVVPIEDSQVRGLTSEQLRNAADNPGMIVIPLIETLENSVE